MAETFRDQLSRVQMMAEDDGETWDLSGNDQAALRAVVADRQRLAAKCNALQLALADTIRTVSLDHGSVILDSVFAVSKRHGIRGEWLEAAMEDGSTPEPIFAEA